MTDWNNPQLSSTYTNFVTEVKDRDVDLAKQFDGVTVSNIATGTIRWDSSANRWKKWDGSAWGELTATYQLTALSTTGTASFGGNTTVTGTLDVSSGITAGSFAPDSSAAPANGISLSAANQLLFSTNSNPRVTINSGGDVGIGKTSPTTTLDVAGGIKAAGTSGYTFNTNDTDGGLFSPADNKLQLKTNNVVRLHIDGQSIGIGTENPAGHLHVNHGNTSTCNLVISNSEGSAFLRADGDLLNYDADGHKFRKENGAELLTLDTSGHLKLLLSGSKMAINKSSASTALDVNGTVTATTFSGSGASLTSLPAAQLTGSSGSIPSSLIPTLNQSTTGNASTATLAVDLQMSGTQQLVLQTSSNNTGVLGSGSSGQVLQSGGSGTTPSWVDQSTLNVNRATDLAINISNRLVVQTGNNATNYLSAGSSGQVLKSNGSGNLPTWQTDTTTTVGFARMWQEESSGTGGGSNAGANQWHQRKLNTIQDPDSIIAGFNGSNGTATNQFKLNAGSYLIRFSCPGHSTLQMKASLVNVTANPDVVMAYSEATLSPSAGYERNMYTRGSAAFKITSATVFELQMRHSNYAGHYGQPNSFSGVPEVYVTCDVMKVA